VVLEGGSYVRCDQSSLAFFLFIVCIVRTSKNDNLGNLDEDKKITYSVIIKMGIVKVYNEDFEWIHLALNKASRHSVSTLISLRSVVLITPLTNQS
jgi:5-enolpyruvylshikimate-3-phosphate synthase